MNLAYILRRVESSAGISSPELNPEQRDWLVDIINEAAEEIYQEKDLPLAPKEVDVRITSDYRIALPPFVGELRALRTKRYNDKWTLADIRTRYNTVDWPEKWNKVRYISIDPIATEITNTAPGTIEVAEADADLVISITGETDDSNNACDTITMDAVSKSWTSNFNVIKSITKNIITRQNVVISDADDQEIAVIYADQREARYAIVDISAYPAIQECADGTFVMEVLYKPRLPYLYYDEDTFPIPDFANTVVLRTKQLLAEDKPGQEERALLMFKKSERKIAKMSNNRTGTEQTKLSRPRNPFYGYFRRRGYYSC
jgi:hypothetical protein